MKMGRERWYSIGEEKKNQSRAVRVRVVPPVWGLSRLLQALHQDLFWMFLGFLWGAVGR